VKASVVVPVWNGREHLLACLDALLAQDYPNFQVIAVDNGSTDGSADLIAERYPEVQVIRNERNLGFAGVCHVGLRTATGDVLVLLNQDTVVRSGWLSGLMRGLEEPQVGIVGSKLLEPDGRTLSHAGGSLEWPLSLGLHIGVGEVDQGQYDTARDVDYVTGASLAFRRNILDKVGLLDERFYPAFYEDVDFCWRTRDAGWRVRYEPRAIAVHDEASSTRHHWLSRHYYHYRNRLLFVLKHFSPPQIVEEFIPAERKRILQLPSDELRAGHVALIEILSMWSLAASDLVRAEDVDREEVLEGLRALREQIVKQQGGDPALRRPEPLGYDEAMGKSSRTEDEALTDELMDLWEIQERPLTSQVPIVGRWISAFRRLWNSVATKWYVRPMVAQQVQFNGAVVRALKQLRARNQNLQAHYWDDDALLALLAQQCGRMSRRVAELEERLAQIEDRLGGMSADGRETDDER
jgi:GT2 family glycosyltransferase